MVDDLIGIEDNGVIRVFFFSEAMDMGYHEVFSIFPPQIIVFCR